MGRTRDTATRAQTHRPPPPTLGSHSIVDPTSTSPQNSRVETYPPARRLEEAEPLGAE